MDIQKHYNIMHRDQEVEWFEPIPTLEGDIIKITEETLKGCLNLVHLSQELAFYVFIHSFPRI